MISSSEITKAFGDDFNYTNDYFKFKKSYSAPANFKLDDDLMMQIQTLKNTNMKDTNTYEMDHLETGDEMEERLAAIEFNRKHPNAPTWRDVGFNVISSSQQLEKLAI